MYNSIPFSQMRVKCTKEVFSWHIPKYGMYEVSTEKQQNLNPHLRCAKHFINQENYSYFKQIGLFSAGD